MTFRNIVVDTPREGIVSGGTDLVVRADNHRPDL
jgi:hypothetical protein